jgi:hypothetical protein
MFALLLAAVDLIGGYAIELYPYYVPTTILPPVW